jgi:sterol 3beta-glucosyltransferase
MIAAAHAGPPPIHNKLLNQENLAQAIHYCLTEEALDAAADISRKMRAENGVASAVKSFRQNLPIEAMSCDLIPEEPAVWLYSRSKMNLKLSDKAAVILAERKKIDAKHLKL